MIVQRKHMFVRTFAFREDSFRVRVDGFDVAAAFFFASFFLGEEAFPFERAAEEVAFFFEDCAFAIVVMLSDASNASTYTHIDNNENNQFRKYL